MEQKTIGKFIAVLRKSSGMTQKQLAQMLNVSDKTISHWERDESAPDISVIPIIAEIFGVTCDELLHGEKLTKDSPKSDSFVRKGEKQLKYLIDNKLNSLRLRTIIPIALTVLGFIAGLISFALIKNSQPAFLISAAFYLIAVVCTAGFRIVFSFSNDDFDKDLLNEYSLKANSIAAKSFYFIFIIFALSLPMITMRETDSLSSVLSSIVSQGLLYFAIALVVCILVNAILKFAGVLSRKNRTKKEKKIYYFRLSVLIVTVVVIASAAIFQYNVVHNPSLFAPKAVVFDDIDAFKDYMQTDKPVPADGAAYSYMIYGETYTIIDEDTGDVVTEFKWLNGEVANYIPDYDGNSVQVYTCDEYVKSSKQGPIGDMLGMIAYGFYPVVIIIGFGVYALGVKTIKKH